MSSRLFGSLTRISDLAERPFELQALPMDRWATGDYVEAEVMPPESRLYRVENRDGVMQPIVRGDRVVGALGHRAATLEGVGSWTAAEDGKLHALTSAGFFGRMTSFSPLLPNPVRLRYVGHALRNGEKCVMRDYAIASDVLQFDVPTILLIGTSMSAGKTLTGRLACEVLSDAGCNVTGAKVTGAGRYRDILAFRRSGAREIYDFVDAGLPSTIVPESEYRDAVRPLLRHIAGESPDYLVCEAGASPMEPYNGKAAIDELGDNVVCRILCATDPYAVVGVMQAFGFEPDLVTGPATNTSAAVDLVRELTGIRGINIIDPDARSAFREFLFAKLGLENEA